MNAQLDVEPEAAATQQAPPARGSTSLLQRAKALADTWPFRLFWRFIGIPAIGSLVGIAVIVRVVDVGPKQYQVVFVGKNGDDPAGQIYEGLRAGLGTAFEIQGIPLKLVRKDDRGDEKQAAEIAERLAKRDDVLLVVGHVSSTPTRAALPYYLAAGIPVLLTTETNPKLLPAQYSAEDFAPVWRLSATDEAQAKTAADYVIDKHGANNFWVVQDSENAVYSKYLAGEFIKKVHERGRSVLLSSLTTSVVPPDLLKAYDIRWVFFAGNWQNALILARQIRTIARRTNSAPPRMIFSDSAAKPKFLEQGGDDIGSGVYLTHPRRASEISGNDGYACYGRDAAFIVGELVTAADEQFSKILTLRTPWSYRMRRVLNVHRVADARLVVRHLMATTRDRGYRAKSSGETYTFTNSGERTGSGFRIWEVRKAGDRNVFADVLDQ